MYEAVLERKVHILARNETTTKKSLPEQNKTISSRLAKIKIKFNSQTLTIYKGHQKL